jgi:hypothetical protein
MNEDNRETGNYEDICVKIFEKDGFLLMSTAVFLSVVF